MNAPSPRRWHQEPMLWLVIALPASTLVAGVLTLWIALQDGRAEEPSPPPEHSATPLRR